MLLDWSWYILVPHGPVPYRPWISINPKRSRQKASMDDPWEVGWWGGQLPWWVGKEAYSQSQKSSRGSAIRKKSPSRLNWVVSLSVGCLPQLSELCSCSTRGSSTVLKILMRVNSWNLQIWWVKPRMEEGGSWWKVGEQHESQQRLEESADIKLPGLSILQKLGFQSGDCYGTKSALGNVFERFNFCYLS